jgi:hypothetical protein
METWKKDPPPNSIIVHDRGIFSALLCRKLSRLIGVLLVILFCILQFDSTGNGTYPQLNFQDIMTIDSLNKTRHKLLKAQSNLRSTEVATGNGHHPLMDGHNEIFGNNVLVVNLDETYLFWQGGQEKLCKLIKNVTLLESLDQSDPMQDGIKVILNFTMDCRDHFETKQSFGQGNWITGIYAARMATALGGVDFKFQCRDGRDSEKYMLLPWFDQYVPAHPNRSFWPYSGTRPTEKETCTSKYSLLRIDKLASQIQEDLRLMAKTVVAQNQKLVNTIDDVAIHFRCGDVLGGAHRNDFGMIRFNSYKMVIPNTTKSIGIFTQPFDQKLNRHKDAGKADYCRTVVLALVEYLEACVAPSASITVRNTIYDTHPITYARMVMANITITSLSSFGIFPVVGTHGEGYFQKGNGGVSHKKKTRSSEIAFSFPLCGLLVHVATSSTDKPFCQLYSSIPGQCSHDGGRRQKHW